MNKLLTVVLVTVLTVFYLKKNEEQFKNLSFINGSGVGFSEKVNEYPLFVNFHEQNLSSDFVLNSTIRKLNMMNNFPIPIGNNKSNLVQLNINKKCPIFLVPDIGASKIFAKWNLKDSDYVKKLDAYGNFETTENWKCKTIENNWTPIWFPDKNSNLTQMCWKNITSVNCEGSTVKNVDGVITNVEIGSLNFETSIYNKLIKSFLSIGYTQYNNIFGLQYDFRTIFNEKDLNEFANTFINYIEKYVAINGKKAILVGHGLGSVLINTVLLKINKKWKDNYIQCFITISGSFGGCPKALRVLLSGDSIPNDVSKIVRDTSVNFNGLHMLLPHPEIYNDIPLILYKQVHYNSINLNSLINVCNNHSINSLGAPEVIVYSLCGNGIPTESNYVYNTLSENPLKNEPYYSSNGPNYTNYVYPSNFNGDGTIPRISLEHPSRWIQSEPINSKFYEDAEHSKILYMNEPVSDILKIIDEFNKFY